MSLSVRPIRADDRPAWDGLWHGYLAFYGLEFDRTAYDRAFAALMSEDPASFQGRLAVSGDGPVGLVHFVYHPNIWFAHPSCYMQDLFVAPTARRTGAGRALINAVYDDARARHSPEVYWLTATDNARARALYDDVARDDGFMLYAHDPRQPEDTP